MTNPNDLTPPPELLQAWINQEDGLTAGHIAAQAARWGADAELAACCELMDDWGLEAADLRAARRPTPSLKEQALSRANAILNDRSRVLQADEREALELSRRALKSLPEDPAVTPAADDPAPTATPGEQYHEGMGDVTWWRFPVEEPPWVGSPNDSDWPGYHTHFTPLPPVPVEPDPAPTADGGVPLWELMRKAHDKAATNRGGYAAELRAVADELERRQLEDYAVILTDVRGVLGWLRAEADRAESGN